MVYPIICYHYLNKITFFVVVGVEIRAASLVVTMQKLRTLRAHIYFVQ